MKNFYLYDDYRDYLKDRIKKNKGTDKAKSVQDLSDATNIQRTYLSKALNKSANLSEDQLFLVLDKLTDDESEIDFITLLHQYNRSSVQIRTDKLKKQIEKKRNDNLRLDRKLKGTIDEQIDSLTASYFLDPKILIVHMFLTIEEYRVSIQKIAKKINISIDELELALDQLEKMQLISRDDNGVHVLNDTFFLPKDTVFTDAFHDRLRAFGYHKKHQISHNNKNNVSMVFTCSKKSFLQIKVKMLDTLKEIEEILLNESSEEAAPEKVMQLSFDLFPWNE